jgi:hypothetical protein
METKIDEIGAGIYRLSIVVRAGASRTGYALDHSVAMHASFSDDGAAALKGSGDHFHLRLRAVLAASACGQ